MQDSLCYAFTPRWESEPLKESRRLEEFWRRLEQHLGRGDRRRLQRSR